MDYASGVEGLKCADLVDAMGRLHRHRCHTLDLVSPTPGRVLFCPAVTISYFPSCPRGRPGALAAPRMATTRIRLGGRSRAPKESVLSPGGARLCVSDKHQSSGVPAAVPLGEPAPEYGRCPARTGDLLLVRREQLLRSTAVCRSDRSVSDFPPPAAALCCGLSLPQRFHMIAPACTREGHPRRRAPRLPLSWASDTLIRPRPC
jgi:hypothetical protein